MPKFDLDQPPEVTPEFVSMLRGRAHGPWVEALLDEVERLWGRERELLAANNAEVEKRRQFEAEANQAWCEQILLRNECRRLRDAHEVLASFIEESHHNGDEAVPEDLAAAMDAVFPRERT